MLDGRVKTLHPAVHGGILARRSVPAHMAAIEQHGIAPIDVVVVNLYPFFRTVTRPGGASFEEGIENVDIGGPAMIRAAAKNHEDVLVVVDPADYSRALEVLAAKGAIDEGSVSTSDRFRRELAWKAYQHTASYDALVAEWLWQQSRPGPRRHSHQRQRWPDWALEPAAATLTAATAAPAAGRQRGERGGGMGAATESHGAADAGRRPALW
eukprot:SM000074S21720  [mRNA]  locus=s74:586742:587888:- [translate_table: standard]